VLSSEQIKQAVEEFKTLYKAQYGIELSDEEATEKAKGLLQIFSY